MLYPYPERDETEENAGEPLMNVSCGQDCTGLIPAAPLTEAEQESYEELYEFLPNAVFPEPRERS